MSERRKIVTEAVRDAKALKEAALAAAKNDLIETMAPAVRRLMERELRSALGEDTDRLRRGVQDNYPGESHTGFEEAKDRGEDPTMTMKPKDDQELDMEALNNFFPQLGEEPEYAEEGQQIPTLEGEEPADEEMPAGEPDGDECPDPSAHRPKPKKEAKAPGMDPGEGDMDEEIEISEEALRQVYEAALQTEVNVKKGFGEMTKMGELEDVSKDAGKGLNPMKAGEHPWEGEEPPAKEEFIKESLRRGLLENKKLRAKLTEAVRIIKTLGTRLHEVNLFNSKVMHVNRILNRTPRLTREQRTVVMESIDKARSIDEVRVVYQTIVGINGAARSLAESRNPRTAKANAQRPRTSGTPDPKVLRESVDGANRDQPFKDRMQQLAGLNRMKRLVD